MWLGSGGVVAAACAPAAVLILFLAWELPYTAEVTIKQRKKKTLYCLFRMFCIMHSCTNTPEATMDQKICL